MRSNRLRTCLRRIKVCDLKKRSIKINKLRLLAAAEERRYGQATGSTRLFLEQQVERLGELNAYRQSYAEKSRAVTSVSPAHWRDYKDFVVRLDRAVRAQQQIVEDGERNLDAHRRRWLVKRQRLKSLEQVFDRYRRAEKVHAERLQQRIMDDLPVPDDLFGESTEK